MTSRPSSPTERLLSCLGFPSTAVTPLEKNMILPVNARVKNHKTEEKSCVSTGIDWDKRNDWPIVAQKNGEKRSCVRGLPCNRRRLGGRRKCIPEFVYVLQTRGVTTKNPAVDYMELLFLHSFSTHSTRVCTNDYRLSNHLIQEFVSQQQSHTHPTSCPAVRQQQEEEKVPRY